MTSSRRRYRLSPATVLFASAIVSAGLVAFVLGAPRAGGEGSGKSIDAVDGASDDRHRGRAQTGTISAHVSSSQHSKLAELEAELLRKKWEKAQGEIEELEVPTLDEARSMRLPRAEPRKDIVELGIDALVPNLSCSLPAVLVDTARSGPGVLGCALEVPGQRPTLVGKAAHRMRSGHFEVGEYEQGKRQGEWKEYFPSGILAARGSFDADQRTGAWDEFDENGIHRIRRAYLYGQKYGATIRYIQDDPEIELWSSVGRLDPVTKEPMDMRMAVGP